MFTSTLLTLTSLLTLTLAQLPPGAASIPPTSIISVIDTTSGLTIGTLNGYGNFSSPGPSYPFRSFALTSGLRTLAGYNLIACTVDDVLACGGYVAGTPGAFYSVSSNVIAEGKEGWSVAATNDAAGGVNGVGLKYGIPVHVGSETAAVPVVLRVRSASG